MRKKPMTIQNRCVHLNSGVSHHDQPDSLTYISLVSGLLSEMALMIRATETRIFEPPFNLLILSHQGVVVFSGRVSRNGRLRRSSPSLKIRRSHFPANAVITDGANTVRTFRIDRPPLALL
jgi:hypothetical protein